MFNDLERREILMSMTANKKESNTQTGMQTLLEMNIIESHICFPKVRELRTLRQDVR